MSFDIYLSAWRKGEPAAFDRRIFEQAFAPLHPQLTQYDLMDLQAPDGLGGSLYVNAAPEIKGFAINRPASHHMLWDAIYEVMRQTPSVLYWPGEIGHSACVASSSVIDEMPVVVTNGMQILKVIEKS